jgi:hypothetical protein
LRQLAADGVEALGRAGVIVVVVAAQQLLRQAVEFCGIERKDFELNVHGISYLFIMRG